MLSNKPQFTHKNLYMKGKFIQVCGLLSEFLILPLTIAETERSFSKLKLITSYMSITMCASGLTVISINHVIAR